MNEQMKNWRRFKITSRRVEGSAAEVVWTALLCYNFPTACGRSVGGNGYGRVILVYGCLSRWMLLMSIGEAERGSEKRK